MPQDLLLRLAAGEQLFAGVFGTAKKDAGRHEVFSDTIENLLRRADCRVIVTAFPPGTASVAAAEEPAAASATHAH